MYKKLLSIVTIITVLFVSLAKPTKAQVNYNCIGNALAQYMNQVIDTAGTLDHVELLSPAFNMTNPYGAQIAAAMVSSGAQFNQLTGIAGNAYNCCAHDAAPDGRITSHVEGFREATGLTNLPVLITETGFYDETIDELRYEMDIVQTSPDYLGALLFNAFGNNDEWDRFSFDNNEVIKTQVCGGSDTASCNKLGVNSASYYPGDENFYNRAADLKADAEDFFTLFISNADQSTIDGVQMALERGLTPVIRVGTVQDAGPDAISYGQFLDELDSLIEGWGGGTVYAIAGPNEPQSECWAAPECGCFLSPEGYRRPLDEGFYLGKYSCSIDDVADPEFHPLRPYPASSCDLLIPQSIPEAPENTLNRYDPRPQQSSFNEKADYLKYNTFACASRMDFSHVELFDAYGAIFPGNVVDGFGNEYLFMACDWDSVSEEDRTSTEYFDLTCWRTVGYEVYADFSSANVGILGNTQNLNLTDEQKVNNYLSWYFTGTPQIGDRQLLDQDDPEDVDRLVNYSGPIRKLLPYDAQEAIREVLRYAAREETNDIHNYALNQSGSIRLAGISDAIEQYFPNIPNSTLEDVPGEAILTSYNRFHDPNYTMPDPEGIYGQWPPRTAPYQFLIDCGVGAHETCPPSRTGLMVTEGEEGGWGDEGGSGGWEGEGDFDPCPVISWCIPDGTDCDYRLNDFDCGTGDFCCADELENL